MTTPDYKAIVQFSRMEGKYFLYNSAAEHHSVVRLTISTAREHDRGDFTVGIMPDRDLVEVYLSPAQFAEAITTLNVGVGTPCTLTYLNGNRITPPARQETVHEKYHDATDTALNKIVEQCKAMIEEIESANISKKLKAELAVHAQKIVKVIDDELPFIAKMFHERLEKLQQEAKAEVAAYLDMAMASHGQLSLPSSGFVSEEN